MSELSLGLVFLAIGFAALVKGTIGFGFPLIAVPIVANILDPRTAVIVISLPALLSNLLILVRGGGKPGIVRRLALMLGGMVVGTVLGAQLLARMDVAGLSLLVGLLAVLLVVLNVTNTNLAIPTRQERYLAPLLGLASGVLGGTTNMFGPVLASYLHSLRMVKKEFVFAITLLFTVGGVTQVLSYLQLGLYSGPTLAYSVLAGVPTVVGIYLGIVLQDRLPPRVWNLLVLAFILLSGLNLIVRGIRG